MLFHDETKLVCLAQSFLYIKAWYPVRGIRQSSLQIVTNSSNIIAYKTIKMSIKLTFVFGLLLASGWTQEQVLESEINQKPEEISEPEKVLEPVKEAFVEAKAEVNLGNKKIQDKLNKEVDENVEKTDNGVEASGKDNS